MALLDGIDWRVEAGQRWAVVGPNGAGKTTLLSVAGALTHPSEGAAWVLGHRLGSRDVRELRAEIGHVDAALATAFGPRMSALEVALTGVGATVVPRPGPLRPGDRSRAAGLLEAMGCAPIARRLFARLSRGEQQRVLLARAGWSVCTGGYHGAMAAASEGASAAGGHVVGVTVAGWSSRLAPNEWVGEERAAEGLIARVAELLESDAWVAVAGGVGTLAEVALAWNLLQSGDIGSRPLVLVGPRWEGLLPELRARLVIDERDLAMVRLARDPEAAVAALGEAGRPATS